MQKYIQQNKDEQRQFFRKIYLSLYSKGLRKVLLCEMRVGDWTELNILTPTLLAIAAFLFRSPGLLNRGPGCPSSGDMVLIPAFSLQLIWTSCRAGLYNNLPSTYFFERHNSHSIQPVDSQGYPQISSIGFTCYLLRCISHLTARPGRRSICYTSTTKYLLCNAG